VHLSPAALAAVITSFQSAALGVEAWTSALERLAAATGSKGGQLIGFGSEAAVPFNLMTGVDPLAVSELEAVNGSDVRINSRVRIGSRAPELAVLDESAFTTAEDGRRYPEYGAYVRRHDIPFICLGPLLRQEDLLVGLAVLRSARQGQISDEQKQAYAAVAPHVRAAVRTQMSVEAQGDRLLAGALETAEISAFVCDGSGVVRGMTARGEAVVAAGRTLGLRGGRLRARHEAEDRNLQLALRRAAAADRDALDVGQSILVLGQGAERLVVQVDRLGPTDWGLALAPRVLVVVRSASTRAVPMDVLLKAFDFTPTEAAIALDLAAGRSREAIAVARRVSLATVRQQVKAILRKADVGREAELVLTIKALG
jgi:DNA-binding CsgD family transcriptional regulator